MEATNLSMDQAIEALVEPETTEEVVEESQSDVEETAELDEEQPETDSEDEGEEVEDTADEPESDDADDEGDEDNDDEVDESEDEEPVAELYTVKVDGEEKQVTLDDLKQGYSGQKYVQQGMQQAAEARKQAEEAYAAIMQERQNLAELFNQVQQGALTPPTAPTRELFDSDPIGYMEAKMTYDEQMKVYNDNVQQVEQQMQQQTEAQQVMRSQHLKQEVGKLVEAMPELADPKKAEAFSTRLQDAGKKFGFTPQELSNITDARTMIALDAAAKWMELQSGKDIVRQKSKKARKPVKAGAKKTASKTDAVRKQRDKLRRSGSIDDAMALILNPDLR